MQNLLFINWKKIIISHTVRTRAKISAITVAAKQPPNISNGGKDSLRFISGIKQQVKYGRSILTLARFFCEKHSRVG